MTHYKEMNQQYLCNKDRRVSFSISPFCLQAQEQFPAEQVETWIWHDPVDQYPGIPPALLVTPSQNFSLSPEF